MGDVQSGLPTISELLSSPTTRTIKYLGDVSYSEEGDPAQLRGLGSTMFLRCGSAYIFGLGTIVPLALFRGFYKVQKKGCFHNAPLRLKISEVANTMAKLVPKKLNAFVIISFGLSTTWATTAYIRGKRDYFNLLPIPPIIAAFGTDRIVKRFKHRGVPRAPFVITMSALFSLMSFVPILYAEGYTFRYMRFKLYRYFNI